MKKKVIITGATSFIGIALISELIKQDCYIEAIIRPHSSRRYLLANNPMINLTECELFNLDKLLLPLETYDELYHIGWSSDFEHGRDNFVGQSQNLDYCIKAVQLASIYRCSTFIGIGSQAECGRINHKITIDTVNNPENAYAEIKCLAYDRTRVLCEEFGIKHCWPRLLSAYGPHDRSNTLMSSIIRACKENIVIELTPCQQIWDYIYVNDVAKALMLIAKSGRHGVKYPIASGMGRKLSDYIDEVAILSGNNSIVNGIGKKEYSDKQVMYLCGDIHELTNDTGFAPEIDFASGVRELLRRQ